MFDDAIVTAFEVAGLLFLAAAAGTAAAIVSLPLGLAAAGVALLVEAMVVALLAGRPTVVGEDE